MKKLVRFILFVCILAGINERFVAAQTVLADAPRTWQIKAPMPTARTGVSAVVLNGQIYVMGGLNAAGEVLDIVERYDPATNSWQNAPKLRTARFNAAAIVFNGDIYLMGGADSLGNSIKKVEVFRVSENDWNSFDNLNDEREGSAALILNDELYVIGGSNGSANILNSVEVLDTSEEKWERSTDWTLDVPRALFGHVAIDDFGYSIGGYSSFGPIGLVQQYHENEGTEILEPLVPGRGGLSAVLLDDTIYVLGGRRSNNQVVNTVDRFFPAENRWDTVPGMITERERFGAVTFDDKIFVFGGNTTSGDVLDAVEVFASSVVPTPEDDVLITSEDTDMSINVLVNDTDPAGGVLSIASFSQPTNGVVTQLNTTTLHFEPAKDFFGADVFTYTVLNETGGTAQATVNVTVSPVNDPPAFSSLPVTGAAQNTLYTYIITATDIDQDMVFFTGVTVPDWLTLMDMQDGEAILQGMPEDIHVGDHDLVIEVSDGIEGAVQSFSISVVEGVPGEPVLLSPANGAADLAQSVTLSWSVLGASSFDLEVSLDSLFNNLVIEQQGLIGESFILSELQSGTLYFWRVRGVNEAGSNVWSEPFNFQTARDTDIEDERPRRSFVLHPNYPNPFKEATWIDFELSGNAVSPVQLALYDLHGRRVITLKTGLLGAGMHTVKWDGRDGFGRSVTSGTYIVRLQHGMEQQSRLIMLIH